MKSFAAALLLIGSMALFSCQKEQQTVASGDPVTSQTQDIELISQLVADLMDDVELTTDLLTGELKTGSVDCRKVTVDPADRTQWPKTITIDFGTDGCLVREGITKKGKIIIHQTAPQQSREWEKTITYENYSVNGNLIEGTHVLTFRIRSEHPVWTDKLTGGKVTTPEGVIRTREAVHIRVQTRGIETPRDRSDDAFQVTGNASGTGRDGKGYSWVITDPLVTSTNCQFIRKGIKEITLEGESAATLNFGDGECDNKAMLTKDGVSKEIILKGR
jgi:hypothetical protein